MHIEHRPALDVIARRAHVDCLLYCDPPYLHTTRPVARGSYKRQYTHEMDNADHAALLDALLAHPGPVLLSGYANPLYDERLAGWGRVERATLAETGARRTEILWSNPIAVARLHARQLAYMESI